MLYRFNQTFLPVITRVLDVGHRLPAYYECIGKGNFIDKSEEALVKIKIEVSAENVREISHLDKGLENVLKVVASNPHSPAELLAAVSSSTIDDVRREAAKNPHASLDSLDKLIDDPNPEVRAAIIKHPSAIQYAWKLVSDPSPLVRYCVALSKEFPDHVYEVLTRDENPRVARRAKQTLFGRNPVVRAFDKLTQHRLAG